MRLLSPPREHTALIVEELLAATRPDSLLQLPRSQDVSGLGTCMASNWLLAPADRLQQAANQLS